MTVVGARGEDWGRLIIAGSDPPSPREVVLIERAATTLALGRLLEQHAQSLERQAHGSIISGILAHAYSDPQEAAARARALGVPLTGRRLLGIVVLPRRPSRTPRSRSAAARASWPTPPPRPAATRRLPGRHAGRGLTAGAGRRAGLPAAPRRDEQSCDVARKLRTHGPRGLWKPGDRRLRPWPPGLVGGVDPRRTPLVPGGRAGRRRRARAARRPALLPAARPAAARAAAPAARRRPAADVRRARAGPAADARRAARRRPRPRARRSTSTAGATRPSPPSGHTCPGPPCTSGCGGSSACWTTDLDDVESCASLHVALLALDSVRRDHS